MLSQQVRIPPLPVHQWGDEQKQVLTSFVAAMPSDFQGGHKDGETDYTALELLLNHPALANAFLSYSHWLLQDNELSARDRELAILRVAVLVNSQYEWTQHVLVAQHEKITDEEIIRVREGANSPGWSDKESVLLSAVDEMVNTAFIGDDTWSELKEYFNTNQLMEIMFTVGSYQMLGTVYNTMGAPLNDKLRATLESFPLAS